MTAVYSIPAGAPLADLLASGLLTRFCPTPEALADALVLVPTRRAARALRDAFLRVSDGRPLLLPRLEAIGDVDDDELLLHAGDAEPPPPIGPLQRLVVLTELVRARPEIDGDPALASRLATSLAQLLDSAALEEVDLRRLDGIVPGDLAAHWQSSLEMLAAIRDDWPAHLAKAGLADAAARRVRALRQRVAAWERQPPGGLVVAAGSTGSIPATADLLGAVAMLPRGMIVLPGLDTELDAASWAAAHEDPAHPQHGLARLLARIAVPRAQVRPWPGAPPPHPRVRLLGEALRPAATTPAWSTAARPGAEAFAGLQRIEAPTQQDEALAIALVLREAVETPMRTAALVTPDRVLARRVSAELQRWGLAVDDSGGVPLLRTPPGAFLRATAAVALDPGAPVDLLAALKHPFACAGLARLRFVADVRRLERKLLRGLRPGPGIAGLRAVAAALAADEPSLAAFVAHLATAIAPLAEAMSERAIAPAVLLERHIALMEWLATPPAPEESRLWSGEAGSALRECAIELADALAPMAPIGGASWPALLEALLGAEVVRARYPTHPRLSIWGPLEARLQSADVVVLGGLTEGSWPPEIGDDPWLSRPMRKALGLPPTERRIGLSAHDFVQAAAGPRVVLSSSRKIDGVPVAASRWLQRLDAFLGAHPAWSACLDRDRLAWSTALDAPAKVARPRRPAPRPPVALRPTRLAVTDVETLVRDPYAVFARRVLRLKPLDGLDDLPDGGDRGNAVHDALRDLLRPGGGALAEDAEARLIALCRAQLAPLLDRPVVRAIWWPRFERLARWFIDWDRRRRVGGVTPLAVEATGGLDLAGGFRLEARADRIDRLVDGRLGIVDYKTGRVPSDSEIVAGFAPQLPLEAAIAQGGGFPGVDAAEVGELLHVRLTGGEPAGEVQLVDPKRDRKPIPLGALIAASRAGLEQLIERYRDPGMPYLARPRVRFVAERGRFDHLARVAEWSAGGDEG